MRISVLQKGSAIRCTKRQRATLQALGLGRIGNIAEHDASPSIVGMIEKVSNLVSVREAGTHKRASRDSQSVEGGGR